LRTEASDAAIVHLHDYERIHRVPWLYEHALQDFHGCHSPQTTVDGPARTDAAGINPAETVLLDLRAGTRIVDELAHELAVRTLIGVDSRDWP
jgi:hypothetical protein